ncbi:MAG: DUF523 and DUF1722 domain-containing protein [Gammaproteobacteria bacterium]
MNERAIRIGVSSCLLGERVRYDSRHKHDAYITGTLGRYFELVAVCPEVAVGLGVPRPPIHLVGDVQRPRACGVDDAGIDVTDALRDFGRHTAAALADISGYLFKSRSPSCGMAQVTVHSTGSGRTSDNGVGIYAREIMNAQPLLPVEEEQRLGDPERRDSFLERVFAYRRWQECTDAGLTGAALVDFHTAHRLSIMAHGTEHCRALDRVIARIGDAKLEPLAGEYITLFMAALKHRATRRRHVVVFRHLLGYLRPDLDNGDKQELLMLIEAYRQGHVPRLVPLTLFRHHFRRHPHPHTRRQLYLNPPPDELRLRCEP